MTVKPAPLAAAHRGNPDADLLVDDNGIGWHVHVSGAGPAMLLVHGTGASSHSFRDLVPTLAERFTVIVPDLPGHGRSVAPLGFDCSLPGMAAALDGLLRSLRQKATIAVGHSAGAAIVTRMTLDGFIAPALLVGLAAALTPLGAVERRIFPSTARFLSVAANVFGLRVTDKKLVEFMLATTGSSLLDAGVEHYTQLFANPQHVSAVLAMMAHWDLSPLYRDLDRLETPLVLVAGEMDRAVSLAHQMMVLRRVPSAKLEVVRGVGHLLHEERPASIASVILREADLVVDRKRPLDLGAA